ncbi:hypothetical protein [Longispora albida]|uniref:hypothetical protein n=1 Tax=Longispora albida TaxID=203523 RepID=UPI00036B6A8B|nr:hypothetical protein [Longispora albida]
MRVYGHVGLMIAYRSITVRGPLCRGCGITLFRFITGLTLYKGWWGPLSLVICPILLIVNLINRARLARLPEASPTPGVEASAPLVPGKPVHRTPAIAGLIIPVVFLGAIGLAIAHFSEPAKECYRGQTEGTRELVECSEPHLGRVLGTVDDKADACPPGSTALLKREEGGYYCLTANTDGIPNR